MVTLRKSSREVGGSSMELTSRMNVLKNKSGQAAVEYVLVTFLVLMIFFTVTKWISDWNLLGKLTEPFKNQYSIIYKYGHVDAKGKEEGGYEHFPDPLAGTDGSRVFINPR